MSKPKPKSDRILYGWQLTNNKPVRDDKGSIVFDEKGNALEEPLPFGQYLKKYNALPGEIISGAPKRMGAFTEVNTGNRRQVKRHNQRKPVQYIVWHDRSIRRVDKLLKKQLQSMTLEQQNALIEYARQIEEANKTKV